MTFKPAILTAAARLGCETLEELLFIGDEVIKMQGGIGDKGLEALHELVRKVKGD